MEKVYTGIDISKYNLDVAVHAFDKQWRFSNDPAGIAKLCKMLVKLEPTLVVFEATGGYELPIYFALGQADLTTVLVNTRQIRDFARSTSKLAKTNSLDAKVIAHFGYAIKPSPRHIQNTRNLK